MKLRDQTTGQFITDPTIHICPDCGGKKSPAAKVCIMCAGKYRERPENYEMRYCKHCGKLFKAYIASENHKSIYCCKKCYLEDHPPRPNRRNGSKVMCKTCGKSVYRVGAEQKKNVRGVYFCSQECYYKYNRGENHTHYIKDPKLRLESRRITDNFGWRDLVFVRDKYTCRICGVVGGRLNAHHIKPWRKYPDQRFNVENGITVCSQCHYKMHKKEENYIEFLEKLVKQQREEQKCLF